VRSRGEASLIGGNGAPSGFQARGRVRGVDTQHACSGRYATAVSCLISRIVFAAALPTQFSNASGLKVTTVSTDRPPAANKARY